MYLDAPVCEAGSQRGSGGDDEACVRREAGTVLDRRKGEHCSHTYDGTNGGSTTCTPYYDVKVRWPGRTAWLSVDSEMYDKAKAGDRTEVRLWQGEVVKLKVRGHTHSYLTSSQEGVIWWLTVGCLILATGAWGAISGRLSGLFAFPNFGWLFVAPGVGVLGFMALFGGPLWAWGFTILWTGFAVFWIVSAWRF
ncbi:hypothetical protein [Streptomyces thermoalcalitolerans]|uniref:Uncharacterized protein n=1 Tax=Streptomyces thermoalcalitolerans TaxID=65605 RepID=A0ABN1NPX7_9ACTN